MTTGGRAGVTPCTSAPGARRYTDGVRIMVIERARLEDAPGIGRLHAIVHGLHTKRVSWYFRSKEPDWFTGVAREFLQQPGTKVLVAREEDIIVGYAVGIVRRMQETEITRVNDVLYIEQIAVDPGFRRRGIGRKLVGALTKIAVEEGLDRVMLETWEFNETARRFFSSMGFETLMRRLDRSLTQS